MLVIGEGVGLGEKQGLGWDRVLAFCFFLKLQLGLHPLYYFDGGKP